MPQILSVTDLQTCLEVAQKAAKLAGRVQMKYFGQTVKVKTKASAIDLVTSVDDECDQKIVKLLRKHFPDHGFVTEETCVEDDPAYRFDLSRTWIIDPLDGTTNYAHGFPQFAVSIAFAIEGKLAVGVVYDPFKKEMFSAVKGRGASLNGQPISVSNTQHLGQALLATGFPYDLVNEPNNNLSHFERILPQCHGVRRPGAAALDLAYLACGRLDGFWELRLSPWDIAAGMLIIEEAGGKITDLTGAPLDIARRRLDLIGSNDTAIHGEIAALLAQNF